MKILLTGASALLLSGAAAAMPYYPSDPSSALVQSQYAFMSVPPVSPMVHDASVEAGLHYAATQSNTDQWTGIGGPEEAAVWQACRPGPGDDRCIQLYERGVRDSYASWTGGGSDVGMGGPEDEPSALTAKNPVLLPMSVSSPDGTSGEKDMAMMQHPDGDILTAQEMQSGSAMAMADKTSFTGVGGPEEEPRVYPRCRSRSDDRCQQGS